MDATWIKWLLGFLAAAFMAWAGVVWTMSDNVGKALQHMEVRISAQLSAMEERQRSLKTDLMSHEKEPAHGEVLLNIQHLDSGMQRLEERTEDNRKSLQEIHKLLSSVSSKLTSEQVRTDRNYRNIDMLWEIVRENQGKLKNSKSNSAR